MCTTVVYFPRENCHSNRPHLSREENHAQLWDSNGLDLLSLLVLVTRVTLCNSTTRREYLLSLFISKNSAEFPKSNLRKYFVQHK